LKLIRSERAAGVSWIGMETIPNVRNPFQVAAIVPLQRKGANHTLGRRPVCIECSRYYDAVKSEEKAKYLAVDI